MPNHRNHNISHKHEKVTSLLAAVNNLFYFVTIHAARYMDL